MGFERKDFNTIKHIVGTVADLKDIGERVPYAQWLRKDQLSEDLMSKVLEDIGNGLSLIKSAKDNDITIFDIMRSRMLDPNFNDAINEALKLRLALLEEKAWGFAQEGEFEEQTQTGLGTYKRKRDSVAMVQFLLKAYHPEKYGVDRKEVRAGPLDTPPEVVRGEGDREKLIAQIENRRKLRQSNVPTITVEAKQIPAKIATLDELLS
jgi:hypothetical protein